MDAARYRRLIARGLAHALLAGPPQRDGLWARATQALGDAAWVSPLIDALMPLSQATWARFTVESLAERLIVTEGFADLLAHHGAPFIRRWILRASTMQPAPMGLDERELPCLGHSAALAEWLGVTVEELDWFTYSPARRRQAPLHVQHYGFSLRPKPAGGGRLLEAPRQRLKALQQQVLHGLLDRVPVHEACHGFTPQRSVLTHAQQHIGQPLVLQFDLRHFFSSIGAGRIRQVFRTLGYPPGVTAQLTALCTVSTPDAVLQRLRDDGWIDPLQAKQLASPHLPQGAPSSPMLANLCAFNLDLRLDGLAQVLGARYSRYADDLVLSGPASLLAALPRLQAWVQYIARDEGYALNPRKTRVATPASQQRICGVVVNQHLNLPRREFDRLRATLHQCALHGPDGQNRDGHADYRAHLWGRLQWARQLNPHKAERLQTLWDRIDWSASASASACT